MTRALAPFAALVALAACGGGAHVYVARRYVAARDCVDPASALDVQSGPPAPSNCAAQCLVRDGEVYVSSMCPPYPRDVDATQTHAACAGAVAAYRRNDTCLADGGTTRPRDPTDAGAD